MRVLELRTRKAILVMFICICLRLVPFSFQKERKTKPNHVLLWLYSAFTCMCMRLPLCSVVVMIIWEQNFYLTITEVMMYLTCFFIFRSWLFWGFCFYSIFLAFSFAMTSTPSRAWICAAPGNVTCKEQTNKQHKSPPKLEIM